MADDSGDGYDRDDAADMEASTMDSSLSQSVSHSHSDLFTGLTSYHDKLHEKIRALATIDPRRAHVYHKA